MTHLWKYRGSLCYFLCCCSASFIIIKKTMDRVIFFKIGQKHSYFTNTVKDKEIALFYNSNTIVRYSSIQSLVCQHIKESLKNTTSFLRNFLRIDG